MSRYFERILCQFKYLAGVAFGIGCFMLQNPNAQSLRTVEQLLSSHVGTMIPDVCWFRMAHSCKSVEIISLVLS